MNMRGLATILGITVVSAVAVQTVVAQRIPVPGSKQAPAASSTPPPPACVGKWTGVLSTGPSKIAQGMDGDKLFKLQVSKAFMKSVQYELDLTPDGTFKATVTSTEFSRRRSKGNWTITGNLLTLNITEDRGVKTQQKMQAMLSSNGKKFVIQIPSKPGIPFTKLIFSKV